MFDTKYLRYFLLCCCAFVMKDTFAGVASDSYKNIFEVILNPRDFSSKNIRVSGYLIESRSKNEGISYWVSIYHDGLDKSSSIKIYMDESMVPSFIDANSLYVVRGKFDYCEEYESCNYKITIDDRIGNVSRPIIKTIK